MEDIMHDVYLVESEDANTTDKLHWQHVLSTAIWSRITSVCLESLDSKLADKKTLEKCIFKK